MRLKACRTASLFVLLFVLLRFWSLGKLLLLHVYSIKYKLNNIQINEEDIEWANLILTMTLAHKEMVVRAFPQVKDKIFTLKEYTVPFSSQDVFDPFGGDLHTYKQTYLELKRLIEELEAKIIGG